MDNERQIILYPELHNTYTPQYDNTSETQDKEKG